MTRKIPAILTLIFLGAQQGSAHAVLLDASPAANGIVAGPDVSIQLRFNARIDGTRSQLRVMFPDQSVHPLRLQRQASPASIESQATGLSHGAYRLQWQVLAADGHITRGEVPFQVQ
jgi:copper resistance protein C